MEVVKNIAAILGVILSTASVVTLISKTARDYIGDMFKKYGKTNELSTSISDMKNLLEKHIEEDKEFKSHVLLANEINAEFAKTQCRNIIKNTFYRYKDVKVLPLYEKKTLINIEDLYVHKLDGNSFASLLLSEMEEWDVSYETARSEVIE